MSQARRAWLLFVLGPVFELHVRFGFGGWRAMLPGVPGAAPASTRPVCVSCRIAGTVVAGQPGAGRAHSRFQQVMKASFQGQSGLILRIRLRAWRTSRAGMCQMR
jgi:hypothetical protein